MMIKKIFSMGILLCISLFIAACSVNEVIPQNIIKKINPEKREEVSPLLLSEINHILFLLKENNLEAINSKFINPNFGFYEVYKDDKENKISLFQKTSLDEISDDIDSFDIKQENANFNCSPYNDAFYGWDNEGVFLTPNTNINLSQLMIEQNLTAPNKYKDEDIKRAKFIEKTSYEVIIPYNIIFYITKIEEQWFITLVDKIKTNCSQ